MWSRFWFAPIDARPMALSRIGVGLIVAWMLLERVAVARAYYSDAGWLSHEVALTLMDRWHWSVFHVLDAPWAVTLGLVLGALAALCFAAGLLTRAAGLLAFVILASVQIRNPAVLSGSDSVARVWMVYLLLMPCGRAWSLDAIRRRVAAGEGAFLAPAPTMEIWPVRLFQLQIALVYLMTGISKYYGADFHDGSALWYALANPIYSRFYPSALPLFAALAPVLGLMTQVTLWWELGFAFMVPFRWLRKLALALGLCVHGGIFVLMKVQFWGPLMLLSYFAYVEPRTIHGLWLRHLRETRARAWDRRLRLDFDPGHEASAALAGRLRALDSFGLIRLVPRAGHGAEPALCLAASGEVLAQARWPRALRAALPLACRPWVGPIVQRHQHR